MNYALKEAHVWDTVTANAVLNGCICFLLLAYECDMV